MAKVFHVGISYLKYDEKKEIKEKTREALSK